MQTAKTVNWNHAGYFITSSQSRLSMRKRPNRDQLVRHLRRQRPLLELAADLDATNNVPHVACWHDEHSSRWFVDFPLLFIDRDEAVAVASENNVGAIYHIASSRIETL